MNYARVTSDNVKALLRLHHLSIRQLAEQISLSASTLTDSLKSKKGIPIDSLMAIAAYFNVSINALCIPNLVEQQQEPGLISDPAKTAAEYQELDSYGRDVVDTVFQMELARRRAMAQAAED
ncbi:MAG: helix-turn-helix domain-containing protein [Clostridiales bacterium]|nr:helix-turn-helix domain-containing protein [Clostridiales bacterium]